MLEDREWVGSPGASLDAIEQLKAVAPVALPESYYALLSYSNGGEGPLLRPPYNFCLHSAEETIDIERDGTFHEFFPQIFVVGGNGGGEMIGFDLRHPTYPIVAVDMTNTDLDESILLIAPTFDEFIEVIGLERGE